jgi:hypothetical protein
MMDKGLKQREAKRSIQQGREAHQAHQSPVLGIQIYVGYVFLFHLQKVTSQEMTQSDRGRTTNLKRASWYE